MCQCRAGLCPNECLFHHWYYFYPAFFVLLLSPVTALLLSFHTHISQFKKLLLFHLSSCGCCLFVLRNIVRFGVSSSPAGCSAERGVCDRERERKKAENTPRGKGNINSSQVIEPRRRLFGIVLWGSVRSACSHPTGSCALRLG